MEWKTIFLELSSEMIEKIDQKNYLGDRSIFISNLLNKQLNEDVEEMDYSSDLTTSKVKNCDFFSGSGEMNLINSSGFSIGRFDIDSMDGFEHLIEKISDISDNPDVCLRARNWLNNQI